MSVSGALRLRLLAIAGISVLCGALSASAAVTFDWVTVGNPGNAADTLVMNKSAAADLTTGYGPVAYTYAIAKNHVTNAQYAEFLNGADPNGTNTLKLYEARMSTNSLGLAYTGGIDRDLAAPAGSKYSVKAGQANYPATWINWNSGARFVNWLSNGQGSGSTETGVYDMSVTLPLRAPGSTIFLPSENEYYKAAYYDPTKNGTGGYWEYGTQSNTPPAGQAPSAGSNIANKKDEGGNYWQTGGSFNAATNFLTDVGAYSSTSSYYGLKDVEGQVYNWTEDGRRVTFSGPLAPIYRGGGWYYDSATSGAAHRNIYSFAQAASYHWFGLRVASLPAPAGLAGDYNNDGKVDAADYTIYRDNFGAADEASLMGNGDGQNGVDLADYNRWVNNFGAMGSGSAAAASAIPEPSTLGFALSGLGLLAIRRRVPRRAQAMIRTTRAVTGSEMETGNTA